MQGDEKQTGVGARKTEAGILGQPTIGCVLGLSTAMGSYDQVLLGPSEDHVDIMHLRTVHQLMGGVAFPTHSHPPLVKVSSGAAPSYFQVYACVNIEQVPASVLPQVS